MKHLIFCISILLSVASFSETKIDPRDREAIESSLTYLKSYNLYLKKQNQFFEYLENNYADKPAHYDYRNDQEMLKLMIAFSEAQAQILLEASNANHFGVWDLQEFLLKTEIVLSDMLNKRFNETAVGRQLASTFQNSFSEIAAPKIREQAFRDRKTFRYTTAGMLLFNALATGFTELNASEILTYLQTVSLGTLVGSSVIYLVLRFSLLKQFNQDELNSVINKHLELYLKDQFTKCSTSAS